MIDEIMRGTSPHARAGAAYAAVNVWVETDRRDRASHLLTQIVSVGEEESWMAALELFRLVDEITPEAVWTVLLEAIIKQIPRQASFPSTFIVDLLQTLLPHEADLVARFSLALTAKWQSELGDLRDEHGFDCS